MNRLAKTIAKLVVVMLNWDMSRHGSLCKHVVVQRKNDNENNDFFYYIFLKKNYFK